MSERAVRAAVWFPGLAVALGAAVATAYGLYEVAVASRVPGPIAWLYPLITDGLALVAYAATARLAGRPARYAWTVVIIAAGLSGLAQAVYLAGGPTVEVAPALRFGVGAWPAVAAAVVAHLLYLLAADAPDDPVQERALARGDRPVQLPGVQSPALNAGGDRADRRTAAATPPSVGHDEDSPRVVPSPARDRAEAAATRHAQRHGAWPTVSELEGVAEVSRGTAAAALKSLRERPLPLHLISEHARDLDDETATSTERTDDEANP